MRHWKQTIQILMGLLASLLLVAPLPVHATGAEDTPGKDYIYSTGETADGKTTSKTWVQTSDSTWTMDVDGDGTEDVMLESTINKAGQQEWTYTFYVEDDQQAYYVYEQMTNNGVLPLKEGYTSTGSDSTDEQTVMAIPVDPGKVDPDTHTYTITNYSKHSDVKVFETGTLMLSKTVTNPERMKNPDQEFVFTIKLSADDWDRRQLIKDTKVFGETVFQGGTATIALGNGDSVTIPDLPEGISYTITETVPDGYVTPTSTGDKGKIVANGTAEAVFTNTTTYIPPAPRETTSFHLAKVVEDDANKAENQEFTLHVILDNLDPYQTITWAYDVAEGEESTPTEVAADEGGFASIDIAMRNGQSATVSDVPVGAYYQVSEDGGEYTASYVVTDARADEEGHTGAIASPKGTGTTGDSLATAREIAEADEDVTITYTNRITYTQDLVLVKKSLDKDGNEDTSDTTEYTFTITFTGLTPNTRIKTSNGVLTVDDRGEIEVLMSVMAGQKVTFYDVPVGMTYRFVESANSKVGRYEITATGTSNIACASKANQSTNQELSTGAERDGWIQDEVVDADENATVTFISESPTTARIQVVKYDSDGKTRLGGAEFEIYRSSDDQPVNYAAGGTSNLIAVSKNGESDVLESPLFVVGKYYLVETKAPEGHVLDETAKEFEITEADLDQTIQINVYDNQIVVLPVTGGEGRNMIYIIAAALAALAAAGVAFQLHRRRTH